MNRGDGQTRHFFWTIDKIQGPRGKEKGTNQPRKLISGD